MDNAEAVKIINNLRFMPGWTFHAEDPGGDTIFAVALIDTVNSDHDQAVQNYPQKITLERAIMVHPEDYKSADDLAAALVTWILEVLIHETREFLRLGSDDLRAPFHPHRREGEIKWDRLINRATEDPMRGLIVLNV